MASLPHPPELRLQVIGELALLRKGVPVELPPSKKTRALLSYLAVTGKAHRRERLCALLWDVTDDPRGALRWSLSKLRALVDDEDVRRISADREQVRLEPRGLVVDWLELQQELHRGLDGASIEELMGLHARFRGEFLEGLALSEFHDFQAWCIGQREKLRETQVTVLHNLVERVGRDSDAALPHLRALVALDPLNVAARAQLVTVLAARGLEAELRLHLESSQKLFRELGRQADFDRLRAIAGLRSGPPSISSRMALPEVAREGAAASTTTLPLVGRQKPWERLIDFFERVSRDRKSSALLVVGEPGLGKTRLLEELRREVQGRGATVLDGRSYEAELTRPYGPWIDALRRLSGHALGESLGRKLAPLVPELGAEHEATSRDQLFGAVADWIAARSHSDVVVVIFDDLQWCDDASAELLHYVVRMNRHRPVLFVLAARAGELPDNEAVERVLRGLRRNARFEKLALAPLDREAISELLIRGRTGGEVDPHCVDEVFAKSAGNPLYAIELVRAAHLDREAGLPSTLRELLRDRIARLPPAACDVLRWCAILGPTAHLPLLRKLSSTDAGALVEALEVLDRHGMLQAARRAQGHGGAYEFTHDLVRQAVYGEISEPRRRLMHLRASELLAEDEGGNDSAVLDLVHHAVLAGEPSRAAEACVRAGRRCARLFANREAATLARQGLRLAEALPAPERVQRTLELRQIELSARRPENLAEAADELEALAEEALDLDCLEHARLGYHLASYLRWEGGEWGDAQRVMMQAERVSRGTNEEDRVLALAEAARCLTLLERDLPHAEALLLEAEGRATRADLAVVAIPDALGLLRWHQGRPEDAQRHFDDARAIARRHGDREGEFGALEHRLLIELQQGHLTEADSSARDLLRLGERLREGSELPFAQVLANLVRFALGDEAADEPTEAALKALRHADAKHRLVHALTRAAEVDLLRSLPERARRRAEEALNIAERLERPSEFVLACVCAARASTLCGDGEAAQSYMACALSLPRGALSAQARHALDAPYPLDDTPLSHVQ